MKGHLKIEDKETNSHYDIDFPLESLAQLPLEVGKTHMFEFKSKSGKTVHAFFKVININHRYHKSGYITDIDVFAELTEPIITGTDV